MSGDGGNRGDGKRRLVRCGLPGAVLTLAFALGGLLPSGAAGERLRIATYNVENYTAVDRVTPSGYRPDYPKPEAEKAALREVIRALDADVLVMQEMGPRPYLEELRRDLRRVGVNYPHGALATAADQDRHLAVLSRRPLKAVHTHTDLEFKYLGGTETVRRGLLEASFDTPAGELTLFAVHLKSRFTERADDPLSTQRRVGEATAIRDRVLRRFPTPATARFLVLGDCNDNRASRAVAALQKRGRTEITTLLPAMDSRGEVWTHFYRREESYTRVDFILVSPGLRSAVAGGMARIHDGPEVARASDHRPVLVVLELAASP